jgi:hypothetical protein
MLSLDTDPDRPQVHATLIFSAAAADTASSDRRVRVASSRQTSTATSRRSRAVALPILNSYRGTIRRFSRGQQAAPLATAIACLLGVNEWQEGQ